MGSVGSVSDSGGRVTRDDVSVCVLCLCNDRELLNYKYTSRTLPGSTVGSSYRTLARRCGFHSKHGALRISDGGRWTISSATKGHLPMITMRSFALATAVTIGSVALAFELYIATALIFGALAAMFLRAYTEQPTGVARREAEELMSSRLQLLRSTSETVHIISTPFDSEAGRSLASEIKRRFDQPLSPLRKEFCYNPNDDCPQSLGMMAGEQDWRGWLDTWMAICDNTAETGGLVFVVFRSDGRGAYGCDEKGPGSLEGQAQPGEVRYATSKGCTIRWMDSLHPVEAFDPPLPPSSAPPSTPAPPDANSSVRRFPTLHGVPPQPEAALHEQRPEVHAMLRAALLGADAALSLTATGVVGTAGLGKTTAAICLAHDEVVQERFADGIVWLVFGMERDALSNLCHLGEALGMPLGEGASPLRDERDACFRLQPLLKDKRVLIVLDDVWDYKRQAKPFKELMLMDRASGSRLLLTTRVRGVAESAGTLQELTHCEDELALRMLAKYMQRPLADLVSDSDARRLVRMSGGLPIVIEQWGVACRSQSTTSLVQDLNKAKEGMEVLQVDASGDYDYGSFFAGLEAQLARLEGSNEREKQEMARCYCMLAVFREDDKVPIDAVRRLWSEPDGNGAQRRQQMSEVSATRVARALKGQQLLKLDEADERQPLRLSLLDLHRQYIVHRGRRSLAGWHAHVLRGCGMVQIGERDGDRSSLDSYWHRSGGRFVHHLRLADFSAEATGGGADGYGDLAKVEKLDLNSSGLAVGDVGRLSDVLKISSSLRELRYGAPCLISTVCSLSDKASAPPDV